MGLYSLWSNTRSLFPSYDCLLEDQKEPIGYSICEIRSIMYAATFLYVHRFPFTSPSVVPLSMAISVMIVVEEEIFITAVRCKCHSRDAQTREAPLESIPSREGS